MYDLNQDNKPSVELGVDKRLEQNRHARSGHSQTRSEAIAGCSERPSSKAAASDEAKRYKPHFVWAVRP